VAFNRGVQTTLTSQNVPEKLTGNATYTNPSTTITYRMFEEVFGGRLITEFKIRKK
jgi:hypothetical protein